MVVLVHAVDVETTGPRIGYHSLLSIGCCCMEINGSHPPQIIDQFFVTIEWPRGLVFAPDTFHFWKQHPAALTLNTTNTVPPDQAAELLIAHIKKVQHMAFMRQAHYLIVTDNPYYDIQWIDFLICQYSANGLPLRHNYFTGWMPSKHLININERIQGMHDIGIPLNMHGFQTAIAADHTPLNDAIILAQKYAYYKALVYNYKKQSQTVK